MKNLLFIFILFLGCIFNGCFALAQQYVEKQESTVINLHKNAGFENGKAGWLFSAPETVSVITGNSALQGSTSIRFESTGASQTVASTLLKVPPILVGSKCQAETSYFTHECSNPYYLQALNASGTVIASKVLECSVLMGIPFDFVLTETLDIDECPAQIKTQIISSGVAEKIDLDSNHVGSVIRLNSEAIADELGYEPVQSVTASGGITITGDLINPVVALTPSGVTSGTYTKVTVDGFGLVTSGSGLTESDIPNLSASKITSGAVAVANGGTGQTTYSTGDILVASGSTLVKKPIGSQGQVLTVNPLTGTADWMASAGGGDSGVNLITNNSFELDVTTDWTTSGVTVARQAFTNGTSSDAYYASMTATVSGAYFETSSITIPDNMRGGDIEFGGYHVNALGAWRADYFVSGTIVASQTLASSTTWVQSPTVFAGVANNQTTTKIRYTSLTSGTATLGLNKVYDGSVKSAKNGAIVGPWESFTAGCGGTWTTNTTYSCKMRRVGEEYEFNIKLVLTGAPNAANLAVNLPTGMNIDFAKLAGSGSGFIIKGKSGSLDTGTRDYLGSVTYRDATSVYVNAIGQAATYIDKTNILNQTVPFTFGATDEVTVEFSVPIVGLSGSGVTFDSRCPTDLSCVNEFSAAVTSAGVVTEPEGLNWISGNCSNGSTGNYVCTFNTNVFASAPHCTATAGTLAYNQSEATVTGSSSVTVITGSAGVAANNSFTLRCSRTTDYVIKNEVKGYLGEQNPTASAHTPSNSNFADNTWTTITFSVEATDRQNMYNPTTGVTTIPRAGAYLINATASFQIGGYSAGAIFEVEVLVNGTTSYMIDRMYFVHATSPNIVKGSTILRFNANDTVVIRARKSNWGGSSGFQSALETRFSITKVDD